LNFAINSASVTRHLLEIVVAVRQASDYETQNKQIPTRRLCAASTAIRE
jgi:hypothetical protein